MEKTYEIDLIDGKFTPLETSKVLFSLLNNKINYHNLEVFSSQIRDEGNVENSKKRLKKLNKDADLLDKLIKDAVQSGKTFEISSTIVIKLVDKK